MFNFHEKSIDICINFLHGELADVKDLSSLCEAIDQYVKSGITDSADARKNCEKNTVINSLKNKRMIYKQNHVHHVSPGFEDYTVKIILSKRRQQIVNKQINKEFSALSVTPDRSYSASNYDPKFHEDFVYSDANWSPQDAHL